MLTPGPAGHALARGLRDKKPCVTTAGMASARRRLRASHPWISDEAGEQLLEGPCQPGPGGHRSLPPTNSQQMRCDGCVRHRGKSLKDPPRRGAASRAGQEAPGAQPAGSEFRKHNKASRRPCGPDMPRCTERKLLRCACVSNGIREAQSLVRLSARQVTSLTC